MISVEPTLSAMRKSGRRGGGGGVVTENPFCREEEI